MPQMFKELHDLPAITEPEGTITYDKDEALFEIFAKRFPDLESRRNATLAIVNKLLHPKDERLHHPTAYIGRAILHALPEFSEEELIEVYEDYRGLHDAIEEQLSDYEEFEDKKGGVPERPVLTVANGARKLQDTRSLGLATRAWRGELLMPPTFEWNLFRQKSSIELIGKLFITMLVNQERKKGSYAFVNLEKPKLEKIRLLRAATSVDLEEGIIVGQTLNRRAALLGRQTVFSIAGAESQDNETSIIDEIDRVLAGN